MIQPNDPAQTAINTVPAAQLEEIAADRMRWANRRRMAWVFTYAAIVYGFLLLTSIVLGTKDISDRVVYATDLFTWIFMGFLSIPTLYFGGTIIEKFTGSGTKKT
jgi:predicted permease